MSKLLVKDWDVITTPDNLSIIVLRPIPQPTGVNIVGENVQILTKSIVVELSSSTHLLDTLVQSRAIIIVEAHEHITRETLIGKSIIRKPTGIRNDNRVQ